MRDGLEIAQDHFYGRSVRPRISFLFESVIRPYLEWPVLLHPRLMARDRPCRRGPPGMAGTRCGARRRNGAIHPGSA